MYSSMLCRMSHGCPRCRCSAQCLCIITINHDYHHRTSYIHIHACTIHLRNSIHIFVTFKSHALPHPRIRWYAVRMWDYFDEINRITGTKYRYIMRMDEESFLHSPIPYDLFGFMAEHDYWYAYRLCSYEMNAIQKIFHNYTGVIRRSSVEYANWTKNRHFNGGSCGFYNNWFIGSLQFFRSRNVQHMLQWFDHEGFMYRDRLNDLVIQTAAVYAFCPTANIHRFLDWSYEHFTLSQGSGGSIAGEEVNTTAACPIWGALSTGYLDPNSERLVSTFLKQVREAQCTIDNNSDEYADPPSAGSAASSASSASVISTRRRRRKRFPLLHVSRDHVRDLSPTYNHLPPAMRNMTILSVKAGRIDLPGRGEESGWTESCGKWGVTSRVPSTHSTLENATGMHARPPLVHESTWIHKSTLLFRLSLLVWAVGWTHRRTQNGTSTPYNNTLEIWDMNARHI